MRSQVLARMCVCAWGGGGGGGGSDILYIHSLDLFSGGVWVRSLNFAILGDFRKMNMFVGWGYESFPYFFKSPINRNLKAIWKM